MRKITSDGVVMVNTGEDIELHIVIANLLSPPANQLPPTSIGSLKKRNRPMTSLQAIHTSA